MRGGRRPLEWPGPPIESTLTIWRTYVSRSRLRSRVAALLIGGAIVAAPVAATPLAVSPEVAHAAAAKCQKAKIGGQSKCIAAGQFCAKRYEKDYNKYGFSCSKKDINGRWHLKAK